MLPAILFFVFFLGDICLFFWASYSMLLYSKYDSIFPSRFLYSIIHENHFHENSCKDSLANL